ncbi:hypothetical protein DPMN_023183 [Dreissena polymorpha]|uniref:Uncharacterized protein n=1 Tax=Dreissena polymorpha TaxID=45954 RepID=A0A9D4LKL4_DREPO|nr:hypothetical protein DPMN_023183 [Dreissena polymorpha]
MHVDFDESYVLNSEKFDCGGAGVGTGDDVLVASVVDWWVILDVLVSFVVRGSVGLVMD